MRLVAIVFVFFSGLVAPAQGGPGQVPSSGTITGRVVDQRGRPMAGARVTVLPSGPVVFVGYILRFVTSDRAGRFTIDRLRFGPYYVYAGKETAGYPGTWHDEMYARQPPPHVALASARPTVFVLVRLGPRAGAITGSVLNGRTGAPLKQATFKITLRDRPSDWLQTGLSIPYTLAVPSLRALEITVSATGYKARNFPLSVRPGETVRMNLRLAPASP